MAECIVDRLEVVEVEIEQREICTFVEFGDGVVEHRMEIGTIGQPCQHVVMCQIGYPIFSPLAGGDVFVGRHGTAIRQGAVRHGDNAAITQLVDSEPRGAASADRPQTRFDIVVHPDRRAADLHPVLENLAKRRAGPTVLRPKPIHRCVGVVAEQQALVEIEHAQTLRHVGQGRPENSILLDGLGGPAG